MKYLLIVILFATQLSANEYELESGYVIIHRHVDENGEEVEE